MGTDSNANAATPSGNKPGVLIFVVDDQKMIGWVVEEILKRHNYGVAFFENPREAYQAFLASDPKPQLLITDYAMAPLNGLELIKECLQVDPNLKTILFSGSAEREIILGHSLKPDCFLKKPFQAAELVEMVQKVLAV